MPIPIENPEEPEEDSEPVGAPEEAFIRTRSGRASQTSERSEFRLFIHVLRVSHAYLDSFTTCLRKP